MRQPEEHGAKQMPGLGARRAALLCLTLLGCAGGLIAPRAIHKQASQQSIFQYLDFNSATDGKTLS